MNMRSQRPMSGGIDRLLTVIDCFLFRWLLVNIPCTPLTNSCCSTLALVPTVYTSFRPKYCTKFLGPNLFLIMSPIFHTQINSLNLLLNLILGSLGSVSMNKKPWLGDCIFIYLHEFVKINIGRKILIDLFELFQISSLINTEVSGIQSNHCG